MASDSERLAVLESETEEATRQREVITRKLDAQETDIKAIRTDVHTIKESISGHIGFLKGVVFVFTALGGLIGAALAAFWDRLTGSQ